MGLYWSVHEAAPLNEDRHSKADFIAGLILHTAVRGHACSLEFVRRPLAKTNDIPGVHVRFLWKFSRFGVRSDYTAALTLSLTRA